MPGTQVVEPLGPGMRRVWDVDEVMLEQATDFQRVLIGRTQQGVTLFCDDERQSTEQSQLVYHEALLVPALLLAPSPSRVLIIGSSEGVASQLAVANGAELVDHVDIDSETVRACAEHLPFGYRPDELAAAERGDGPVRVHYRDGWGFLADAAAEAREYDVVVIDLPDESSDPEAQHNRLYAKDFLTRCTEVLAPQGILACQAGCPTLWRNDTLRAAWQRFSEVFAAVVYYGSDEHEWAFLFGSAEPIEAPVDTMVARLPAAGYRPSSVDAEALRGCTVPPHSVRRG